MARGRPLRRRVPDGRPRRATFSSIEGDHFTILGMPLIPLLEALRERGLMPHDHHRAHRVDRHGQVDGRQDVRARRRAGVRCRRRGAPAARRRAARWSMRSSARFPGSVRDGAVDREALSALVLGDRTSSPRWKRSSTRRCIRRGPASSSTMAMRRPCCSTFPCCSKPAARGAFDKVIVVSAPADVQRERVLSRPGMTADKARRRSSPGRCPTRKSARAPISSSTPGGSLEETERQVEHILACLGLARG